MIDSSQKRYDYFCGLELLYLNFKNNEDDFLRSWEKFKKNPTKAIITNHADAQFYADCEKFTKLIITTRIAREELEKRWNELVSDEKKIREKRNVK
jgi:hypothetical protein